jgi:hypothetical protein
VNVLFVHVVNVCLFRLSTGHPFFFLSVSSVCVNGGSFIACISILMYARI